MKKRFGYQCAECEELFESFQELPEGDEVECPACGKETTMNFLGEIEHRGCGCGKPTGCCSSED